MGELCDMSLKLSECETLSAQRDISNPTINVCASVIGKTVHQRVREHVRNARQFKYAWIDTTMADHDSRTVAMPCGGKTKCVR